MIFKKKYSCIMALVIVSVILGSSLASLKVSAASGKSVTVKTVKGIAKMADKGYTDIVFKYKKSGKVIIPLWDYYDVNIVFNAPKAKITNNGSFNSVTVKAAKSFTQTGYICEKMVLSDKSLSFKLTDTCQISLLEVVGKSAKIKLNIEGYLEKIEVKYMATLTIANTSLDPIRIVEATGNETMAEAGEKTVISARVPVEPKSIPEPSGNLAVAYCDDIFAESGIIDIKFISGGKTYVTSYEFNVEDGEVNYVGVVEDCNMNYLKALKVDTIDLTSLYSGNAAKILSEPQYMDVLLMQFKNVKTVKVAGTYISENMEGCVDYYGNPLNVIT